MPTTQSRTKNKSDKPARSSFQIVRVVQVKREPKLELRERLSMTRETFSRIVNVSVRTIAAVEREQTVIAKLQRPYAELGRLYAALNDVIDAKAIGPWFTTPNPAFGELKPMELIERGEIDRLWSMVYRLRSGMPG